MIMSKVFERINEVITVSFENTHKDNFFASALY